MKFNSHLFLRWFTWQNNKNQGSIYYSQHCQPSFAKAINLSLKTLPPFPKQYRRSASNRWESCPAAQHFPPHAACSGLGEDLRNSFSSARPNMWTGQSQERLTSPSVSYQTPLLGWGKAECNPGPWQTKYKQHLHTKHCGLKLQVLARQKSEIRANQTRVWSEKLYFYTYKHRGTLQGYYPSNIIAKYFQFFH